MHGRGTELIAWPHCIQVTLSTAKSPQSLQLPVCPGASAVNTCTAVAQAAWPRRFQTDGPGVVHVVWFRSARQLVMAYRSAQI